MTSLQKRVGASTQPLGVRDGSQRQCPVPRSEDQCSLGDEFQRGEESSRGHSLGKGGKVKAGVGDPKLF